MTLVSVDILNMRQIKIKICMKLRNFVGNSIWKKLFEFMIMCVRVCLHKRVKINLVWVYWLNIHVAKLYTKLSFLFIALFCASNFYTNATPISISHTYPQIERMRRKKCLNPMQKKSETEIIWILKAVINCRSKNPIGFIFFFFFSIESKYPHVYTPPCKSFETLSSEENLTDNYFAYFS